MSTTSTQTPPEPRRIRWIRGSGEKLPTGFRLVGRSSRWGNPYKLTDHGGEHTRAESLRLFRQGIELALRHEERQTLDKQTAAHFRRLVDSLGELRGLGLACSCHQHQACHADILIEYVDRLPDTPDTP